MSSDHKLAAILFADIAGYTAMMQKDEQSALELLNRFKEVLEDITPKHQGRIVQYFGDGCLLAFESSTNSVDCAIALQGAFSKEPSVPVRVGLHLGDVIFRNENVFGDGVNIASRIESLGIPGSILMSKPIRDQIKNKSDFLLVSLGSFDFKNVSEPMEVFALANPGFVVPKREDMHGKLKDFQKKSGIFKWLIAFVIIASSSFAIWYFTGKKKSMVTPLEKSIAVLPFNYMSNDKDQEYFVDGMTVSISTELGKRKDLLVISGNSTFQYKGKTVDEKKVGNELNVNYILEGSVQRTINQLRVSVKLIDVTTGYQVWAEHYDKEIKDVFIVQDDIARSIVAALNITLKPDQANVTNLPPTKDIKAYDTFLLGMYYRRMPGRLNNEKSIGLFEKAVALDPQFALAHAKLASTSAREYFSFDTSRKWEQKAFIAVQKALTIDPNLAEAYYARGELAWTLTNRFPHAAAVKDFKKAKDLNHNLDDAYLKLGGVYHHIGLLDQALKELDSAQRIDPNNLLTASQKAMTYLDQGQYEKVLTEWEKNPELSTYPRYVAYSKILALNYLGRKKEALALVEETLKQNPKEEVTLVDYAVLLADAGDFRKAEKLIEQAIQNGQGKGHFHHVQYYIGAAYAIMGKKEQAIEWLMKAADEGFPCFPAYEKDPYLNNLRSDPRFVSFLGNLKKQWENYKASF